MNNPKNQNNISRYVKLEDYKVFDYEIPEIFLDFVIKKNAVNVTTKLKLVKKNKNTRDLILDGTDILIKKIFIDDSLLGKEYYEQQKNNLKVENINKDNFILKIPLYTNYYLLGRLKHIFVKQKITSQTYNFKISILDFLTSELLCKDEQSKKPK